jgi:protein-tyrosine phosphatase
VATRTWLDRALHALLTHRAIMPLKHAARDAYWQARGRAIANPPLPATVDSVLFVCKGNICRSPFAAGLARRLALHAGLSTLRCESAGLSASQAARSPQDACATAAGYGVTLGLDSPLQITDAMIASFDIIVVMEAWQALELAERYPARRDRVFLLPLLERPLPFGYARYHIADPFGHGPDAFSSSFARIDKALRAFVATLVSARGRVSERPAPERARSQTAERRDAEIAAPSARQ